MSDHKDVTETLTYLLNAPYPFHHQHYKRIFEKSNKFPNMYHCNVCQLKLLGDKQLTEHNGCFSHQVEMEKQIIKMLEKSANDRRVPSIAVSEPSKLAKKMLRDAAINASKMKLNEEWTQLKCQYDQYGQNPSSHPMYEKEWKIFYYRTLSNITAANEDPNAFDFGKYWEIYWKQRIQVYYNKDWQKIVEEIGANYHSTVFRAEFSDESSNDGMHKASRPTSSLSSNSDVFCVTDGKSRNAPSPASDKNIDYSDMDLSNGSDADDGIVFAVSHNPAPKLRQSPKINVQRAENDMKSSMPTVTMENPHCVSFHQNAVDVAMMNIVLQHLEKSNLSPEQLTDDQLRSYIKYIIDLEYYKKNLRSGSVDSHASAESSHSR